MKTPLVALVYTHILNFDVHDQILTSKVDPRTERVKYL